MGLGLVDLGFVCACVWCLCCNVVGCLIFNNSCFLEHGVLTCQHLSQFHTCRFHPPSIRSDAWLVEHACMHSIDWFTRAFTCGLGIYCAATVHVCILCLSEFLTEMPSNLTLCACEHDDIASEALVSNTRYAYI